jgi:hypothetical protein
MKPTPAKTDQRPSHIKDFILLLSIPLGIAVIVAAFVYIPVLFAHPKFSFVYEYCPDYGCNSHYVLNDEGKLTRQPDDNDQFYKTVSRLGVYDPTSGSSRALTDGEAQDLQLINATKSPDGYTLVHESGDSGTLFWSNYHDGWHLENGLKKKTVQFYGVDPTTYGNNVTFIGWVQK